MSASLRRAACLCCLGSWAAAAGVASEPAGVASERAVTRADIELLSDPLAPHASAFAPGRVAWVEPGGGWYQIVLRDVGGEGREQVIDFSMPVLLGGGAGFAWLGVRSPSLPAELCVAAPEIRCAASPAPVSNTGRLQVGALDGEVVVWWTDITSATALRLDGDRWQAIALPDGIDPGALVVLPGGDGFLLSDREGVTRWTRSGGAWASERFPMEGAGHPAMSETHLLVYKAGPVPLPTSPLILHERRPPGPGQLRRVRRDGGGESAVEGDVGFASLLLPHGEEGALLVGSHQAEYWRGDERAWRIPSSDMSGAIWEGAPWVSVGSTRMRLDGDAIVAEDTAPGRFTWAAPIAPELASCGGGHGLRWRHDDVTWYAWMSDGAVQIGHACPGTVGPWPPGPPSECAGGALLEVDDHVACVALSTRQYATRASIVQLTRRSP